MTDNVREDVKKSLFTTENTIVGALLSALLYLGIQQVQIKETQAARIVQIDQNITVIKELNKVLPTVERVNMKVDGVLCMLQYRESNVHAKEKCLQEVINGVK